MSEWDWFEAGLPWSVVPERLDIHLEQQPTLVAAEVTVIVAALVCLVHAFANGRQHLLLWVAALTSGIVNDIFFMVLPFVDTFWHAQCTVMLTARLPLYIPCLYVVFAYVGVATSWRMRLGGWSSRAALAALLSTLFYSIFDAIGAKFLWWTWHDTDASVSARWLGVPFGSTTWIATHVFTVSALLHLFALRRTKVSAVRFVATLLGLTLLVTPLMMALMSVVQLNQWRVARNEDGALEVLDQPGRPDDTTLAIVVGSACFVLAAGLRSSKRETYAWLRARLDRFLFLGVVVQYTATMLGILSLGFPSAVVSAGVHQTVGPCDVREVDLSGYERSAYLCPTDFDEDFSLDCVDALAVNDFEVRELTSWYTVCGRPFRNRARFVVVVGSLAVFIIVTFGTFLLSSATRDDEQANRREKKEK